MVATPLQQRLAIAHLLNDKPSDAEGYDVMRGLNQSPKILPARYFYDDDGSELFEQICDLPEYYLTRAETAIFQQYADELVTLTGACEIIELGSGSSTKTRLLLDAYQRAKLPLHYSPIDVSAGILQSSAQQLLQDYPTLQIQGLVGTYELALQHLPHKLVPRRMICFIGSTLGNLNPVECEAFLDRIRQALAPGDFFLLGVDLQKEPAILEAAYNDRQGVTAAFNLNILRHLNRRFAGNFDLQQFSHEALYNPIAGQIEMHLRSHKFQTVTLEKLGFTCTIAENETILSEISRKFNLPYLELLLASKQLPVQKLWTDPNNWFGLLLCQYCKP
ncbi:MAG: L-histidine N(alpha)-methyltransferase [Synechococcales bacterium]|nr:L-histidine N(alpha)-methyltransferase [Synechococcales bacterium]